MDAIVEEHSRPEHLSRWPERCQRVALVLHGGGALGAYQAGVYQARHEAEIEPDWVSGVSIGAINSAIIAGNSRRRPFALHTFWERITERKVWHYTPDGDLFRKARDASICWLTLMQGQPGFFSPRAPGSWFSLPGASTASSYESTKLTLKRKDWLTMPEQGAGLVVHDVHREDEFR